MGTDEEATLRTLQEYKAVMASSIQHHRGRIVGTAGDSVLAEFASVVDAQAGLAKKGVAVAGITPDDPAAQKKFDEKYQLNFPLLSDGEHSVAKTYGAWGNKMMYGKKTQGIIRSSFLIDEQGKIMHAWYKIGPEDTVPEALAVLAG